jgi:serine/threonine protein kinase
MPQLNDLFALGNTIDTFAPGHYARVYEATDRRDGQTCAFKVMRAEHVTFDSQPRMEANAFINEADLLIRLAMSAAAANVIKLMDCGYVNAQEEMPRSGEIESYGLNIDLFRQGVYRYAGKGWRPYLALEWLPRGQSLFYVMRASSSAVRWRLPTEEGLDLAYQFGRLLREAHRQKIVYLDHKLEHVYWDGQNLKVIDWNSSRFLEHSPNLLAQQINSDITNLCIGVLYTAFTGLSPKKGALVAQPGDQAAVDGRYSGISQLDFGAEPTLSQTVQSLLNQGAARNLASAEDFLDGLAKAAEEFGWHASVATPSVRAAREHVRRGLMRLREGQEAIREGRDLLREAAIMEDIHGNFEVELRRMLNKINEMLNTRPIP